MQKVLMVCLGNICRSPLAEGIMLKLIKENNINMRVDSAGTSNYHVDEAPDKSPCDECPDTIARGVVDLKAFVPKRSIDALERQSHDACRVLKKHDADDHVRYKIPAIVAQRGGRVILQEQGDEQPHARVDEA